MVNAQPHFLLFSGVERAGTSPDRWHFLLESLDGQSVIEASDREPGVQGERLELLALIRGLEALDQPSRVTLITASRDVSRGIRYGLEAWRLNDWCWERDGRWVPIKNRDLWQRVERALHYHRVECRRWSIESPGSQESSTDVGALREVPLDAREATPPAVAPRELASMAHEPAMGRRGESKEIERKLAWQTCWRAVARLFRPEDSGPTLVGV